MGPWIAYLNPGYPGFCTWSVVADLTAEPSCQKECHQLAVNFLFHIVHLFAQSLDLHPQLPDLTLSLL